MHDRSLILCALALIVCGCRANSTDAGTAPSATARVNVSASSSGRLPSQAESSVKLPPQAASSTSPASPQTAAKAHAATTSVPASAPAVDAKPRPQLGRILCGKTTCETGKEICCLREPPDADKSACVALRPNEPFDLSALDQLCDDRAALLVSCGESKSCGAGRACCEIMWGSGQNQPIVCAEPRPAEPYACEYGEPCVSGVPCATVGAVCLYGWCTIPRKKAQQPIKCGTVTCGRVHDVCCNRSESDRLECTTDKDCEQPDREYSCTSQNDCDPGEFCGIMPAGGNCMHSNDGGTEIPCDAASDCPISTREWCKKMQEPVVCSPSDSSDAILRGRKVCRCGGLR